MARLVRTLLDQADGLGRELRPRPVHGVLCHGDSHVLNVLIEGDEKVWLVDWDDVVLVLQPHFHIVGRLSPLRPLRMATSAAIRSRMAILRSHQAPFGAESRSRGR